MADRACDSCGVTYVAKRPSSRFCGPACRVRASRGAVRPVVLENLAPADRPGSGVSTAVRGELEDVSRAATALGVMAIALAERIDAGGDTGSALAALARELRATFDAATANAARPESKVDELRRKREARARSA